MRWIHIVSACLVLGGFFFMRVLLPVALAQVDEQTREAILLKLRRSFKIVVHSSILMFLVSGIFNTIVLWPQYKANPGLTHGMWGMHVLLALVIFAVALVALAGKQPKPFARTGMMVSLILIFLAIAFASTLKWARERGGNPQPGVTQVDSSELP